MKRFSPFNLLMGILCGAASAAFLYAFTPFYFLVLDAGTSLSLTLFFGLGLYGCVYFLRRTFLIEVPAEPGEGILPTGNSNTSRLIEPSLDTARGKVVVASTVLCFALLLFEWGLSARVFPEGSPEPTQDATQPFARNGEKRYFEPDAIALLRAVDYFVTGYMFIFLPIVIIYFNIADSRSATREKKILESGG